MTDFVNFAVTSHYSIQRSTIDRSDIIKKAKSYRQKRVALTEKGCMFRWFDFIKKAKAENIQPILGLQIKISQVWPDMWVGKRYRGIFEHPEPQISLIAKNLNGLRNLMKISTLAMNRLNKFNPNELPQVSFEDVEKYKWDLACLSGHFEGIPGAWLNEDKNIGEAQLLRLHEIFGEELYLEVQDHTEEDEEWLTDSLINSWYEELSVKHGIKLIATNSAFYKDPVDSDKLEVLDAIRRKMQAMNGTGKTPTSGFYLKSEKDFERSNLPEESIVNIYTLSSQIEDYGFNQKNLIVPYHRLSPDHYTFPDKAHEKLEGLCRDGMKRLNLEGRKEYEDRLTEELEMIESKDFSSYFLVVGDIMSYMKKEDILTPVGRGSAGGSLVCYLLDITSTDPIQLNLPFWRFISSARKDMPDIDNDVPNKRRKDILTFIRDTYGPKRVGQIATFVTMQPKNAIENVGRVLGVPRPVRDKVRAAIPFDAHSLTDHEGDELPRPGSPERVMMDQQPGWWETAAFLCGKCNNIGYHPAALVISNDPLEDCSALMPEHEGYYAVQLDMHDAEDVGLLKLDMLGLRTLDQIKETFDQVERNYGEKLTMQTIPIDDSEVFAYYAKGEYLDIFQSSKGGFRKFIKKLKPETIEHISAAVALYRPGALCLSGDTKILVNKMTRSSNRSNFTHFRRKLSEIYRIFNDRNPDMEIVSLNEDSGRFLRNKIKKVWNSGVKPVYNIRFLTKMDAGHCAPQLGINNIEATLDHRFLSNDGWKPLKDFRQGDYICLENVRGFDLSGEKVKRGPSVNEKNIKGTTNFKNICLRNYEYACIFCDWLDGSLDVNHLESNRFTDNSPDNLNFFCPNHHRMYSEGSISKEDVVLAREKYKLPHCNEDVYFAIFYDVQYVGDKETYDIEMESPYNNFVAGNFVVHNSAGFTDEYCDRKNGLKPVESLHPAIDPFLSKTYNLIVYQEDMMRFAMAVGGLTDGEADKFRKAIGKKDKVAYDALSDKILQGAIAKGYDELEMKDLMSKLSDFSRYCFNLAHSASYGMNAYVTAYLEYYYPLEYAAATLNAYIDKMEDRKRLVEGAIRMGIRIVKPDVNKSNEMYRADPVDKCVYIGLRGVEGLNKAAEKIVKEREKNGPYKSYLDFMRRLPSVSKKVVENLVKIGAFTWDKTLSDIDKLDNMEIFRKTLKKKNKSVDGSKLTDEEVINFPGNEPALEYKWFSPMQISENEHKLLGFFTTEHPATVYTKLSDRIFVGSTKIYTPNDIVQGPATPGEGAFVLCKVDLVKPKETKKGKPYLMVCVSDQFSKLFFNIWSPECDEFRGVLKEDTLVCLESEVVYDKFHGSNSIRLKRLYSLQGGIKSHKFIANQESDKDEIIRRIQKYTQADVKGEPENFLGHTVYELDRRVNLLPSLIKEFCEGIDVKIIPAWR